MNNFFKKNSGGYTIIETMIAVAIFTTIATTGMAALLNANVVHNKSGDMRSIIDSLSFIMEEMGRNIRTGSTYRCIYDGDYSTNLTATRSCSLGGGIVFESALGDSSDSADQWIYKIESTDGGVTYNISKSIDSGASWTQLNPPEVVLSSISGFSVLGAPEYASGDSQQPLVLIKLVGSITYKNVVSPFSLETVVSQRLVDI